MAETIGDLLDKDDAPALKQLMEKDAPALLASIEDLKKTDDEEDPEEDGDTEEENKEAEEPEITEEDKAEEPQEDQKEEQKEEEKKKEEEKPAEPVRVSPYFGCLKVLSKTEKKLIRMPDGTRVALLPDFDNNNAWKHSSSPYNYPGLWGQCTWFAWGRFYELYGFDPGFSGHGYECVNQLVAAHPDKFEKSSTPKPGAVFSADAAHNHVGLVLDVDPETGNVLIQEGNFDGATNPVWNDAIQDWETRLLTFDQLKRTYGDVTFANPVEGKVSLTGVVKDIYYPAFSFEDGR